MQKYNSVYDAVDVATGKFGLQKGGAPIAQAARLVADDQNNVCLPVTTKKTSVTLDMIQALGAVTSGDISTDVDLPDGAIVLMTVLKPTVALVGGRASGVLTSDNTNVANGDTVTIDTKVYTFKTSLTPTEGQILIGGSADASLLNLINAVNHTGTPGTDYSVAAVHPTVTADATVTSHAATFRAKVAGAAADSIATTETSAHLSFGAGTLAGGDSAISAATGQAKTSVTSFGTARDLKAAVSATNFEPMATSPKVQTIGAATPLLGHLVLTGGNAADVTAGAFDMYVVFTALV